MRKFSNASILVVDDSSTMRTVVSGMLRQLRVGHIAEASDGEDALRKVAAARFDVIISDWHMEPMNGLELLKRVRRTSHPNANRFIFLTAEKFWGNQTTAKIEGAQAFITKPFKVDVLKSKLEAVLG